MKKVVLAFDSFKGSVTSAEASQAVAQMIHRMLPDCEVESFHIADGGEGTIDAVGSYLQASRVCCRVHDPLMRPIEAGYAVTPDGMTAVLEVAAAGGLPLVEESLRNPSLATSFGTGELICHALDRGCRRFILGLGGSATNDAGIGLLAALGVRFFDAFGCELNPIGGSLSLIDAVDVTGMHPALSEAHFTLACDVTNPFWGEQGAACVYAPQKGATCEQVKELDEGLCKYASVLQHCFGCNVSDIPGAGAAGGMGGGLLPFLSAELKSGIDIVLEMQHFSEALDGADWVFTGEGRLDEQTTMGKALGGVLRMAQKKNVPVVALGGSVEAVEMLNAMGFTAVFSIVSAPQSLQQAMQKDVALRNLTHTVQQLLRLITRLEK